ncbi:pentapeptide repeat-containing protein [Metabacillus schmidteae]|uniref:pentapeptide repeat-containing protein n=1 Tax=Metabacillus schmidteae TaxID=2730405 RepID=UPI00158EC33E|nr:pentapeptide repeat-containing protein [Metabacillus schmidteae]
MSVEIEDLKSVKADCENCFGLCCVALPYLKSADFAYDKDSGIPCENLQTDYRCGIHRNLRKSGFRGCTVYECFGAGQKVSQFTYSGRDWRKNKEIEKEMFEVFPVMQQLHEMLRYLYEALNRKEASGIQTNIQQAIEKTERLTHLNPQSILKLDIIQHREYVNHLLIQTSEYVRANVKHDQKQRVKLKKGIDLIGSNFKGANFKGANLRGAFLIACDLRNSDLRFADFIGADLRDANICGANLTGSIFLTQVQVNSANGDHRTKLPPSLEIPSHWLN